MALPTCAARLTSLTANTFSSPAIGTSVDRREYRIFIPTLEWGVPESPRDQAWSTATASIAVSGTDDARVGLTIIPTSCGTFLFELANGSEHEISVDHVEIALTFPRSGLSTPLRFVDFGLQSTDMTVGVHSARPGTIAWMDHGGLIQGADDHLLVGWTSSERFFTSVAVTDRGDHVEVRANCVTRPKRLDAGATLLLEELCVARASDHDALLSAYAERISALAHVRSAHATPPTGWLSWYYYYSTVSEDDILAQLPHLRSSSAPTEFVVIDAGWFLESGWGDWEPNERFPHGMKQLADRIRDAGLRPGLWFSPLLVSATSRFVREHPEMLLRDTEGEPVVAMGTALSDAVRRNDLGRQHRSNDFTDVADDDLSSIRYVLDLDSPAVHSEIARVITRATHEWGYEFLKLDFLIRALITDRPLDDRRPGPGHDFVPFSRSTGYEAYRSIMATIRSAAGPSTYILGCAAPLLASAGSMIDGNRMTPDITRRNYGGEPSADRPSSWELTLQCARSMAARYFLNGRIGHNDPDVIVARDAEPPDISDSFSPSVNEAQVWSTVVALAGGLAVAGDDLSTLTAERRAIAFASIPAMPRAAIPRDFFTDPAPAVWSVDLTRDGARWTVAAMFNWSEEPQTHTLSPESLGLANGEYFATEFWSGAVHGPLDAVERTLPPRTVECFAFRRLSETPTPTVLGSNVHLSQGLSDIGRVDWDGETFTVEASLDRRSEGIYLLHLPGALFGSTPEATEPLTAVRDDVFSVVLDAACPTVRVHRRRNSGDPADGPRQLVTRM